MNKDELKNFVTAIKIAFPNFKTFDNPENQRVAIDMWLRMLGDIDYSTAMIALESHVATNKFPPTIADIRNFAVNVSCDNQIPTSSEAWGQVLSAIRNHGMYDATGAFASMNSLVAGVAKRFGWTEICTSENIDVVRGQFTKQYESQANGAREYQQLASSTKANIANKQALDGIINTLADKFGDDKHKTVYISNVEYLNLKRG